MGDMIRTSLAGCCLAVLLISPAFAEGGQISFVGAIVAPTCSFAGAIARRDQATLGCGAMPGGRAPVATLYRQDVVSLDAVQPSSDPLLHYFAGYVGAADVRLMTRTYE